MWIFGLVCGLVYLYGRALPPDNALRRATYPNPFPQRTVAVPNGVWITLAGLAALLAAPWYTSAIRGLDIWAARALLGPSRADELEHRVEHLTQTRAGVVDAADAERRRLERDLHDGTQQRLVSLAINLGMARAQAGTAEEAKVAIAEAHEEAKAALAELRDLIRGLHPAVLEDRGLDAALSGVAARMPIPVRLTVDLPRRPAPVIEAVAYFVVSEGLANIAKHSQATEAAVFVQRAGDRLHVIVTDDGVGRRRPGPRHRPRRPGPARRFGRRDLRNRQPARRADPSHRGPAMQPLTAAAPAAPASPGPKATRGRWVWTVSGVATVTFLTALGIALVNRASTPAGRAGHERRPDARRHHQRSRSPA